jgi:hypothetical protein
LNLKNLLKRKHIFSYNCYKYILLDYDSNLEFGKPYFFYESIVNKINLHYILGGIYMQKNEIYIVIENERNKLGNINKW